MLSKRYRWIAGFLVIVCAILAGCNGDASGLPDETHRDDLDEERRVPPQQQQRLQQLDETADRMYAELMKGDLLAARERMRELGELAGRIEWAGITSVEGMEALMTAIVQAKELMNAVQAEPARLQTAAAQVRLTTDALLHRHQPLWLDYEKTLRTDTEKLREAVEEGRNVIQAAQQIYRDYQVIRPAVLISRPIELNGKIESLLAFFMQQANVIDDRLLEQVAELSRTWDELFGKDVSAYLPYAEGQDPTYWTLVIGSIIITVLCFVAYRKYQSEMDVVPVTGRKKIDR